MRRTAASARRTTRVAAVAAVTPMTAVARMAFALTVILASVVGLVACGRTDRATLGHDAYIWQRQWTDSLDRAVIASASRVRVWRVLAAEVDGRGAIVESSPHLDVLTRAGRPAVPVIRINGRLSDWDENDLIRRSQTLVQRWRDAGVTVTGLEVDYDCPTASLRRYASFLAALRKSLRQTPGQSIGQSPAYQGDLTLSITALPSWLDSAYLRDVLEQVDESVLQVHAVEHPRAGLFEGERARTWARAWADVSDVPFRVALPTYGSRVTWTRAGRITAIESEGRTFADPRSGRELFATPLEVTAFIDHLRDDRPSNLAGLVWFRLPTADDERAWSRDTWHAVMDGRALDGNAPDGRALPSGVDATVELNSTIPGLYDVYLRNGGIVDTMIPERVTLTSRGSCEAADAVAPYAMEKRQTSIEFRRVSPRLLARDRRTLIGWVRCPIGEIQVHGGS